MLSLKDTKYKVGNIVSNPYQESGTIPDINLDASTFYDSILALYGNANPIADSFFLYLIGFLLLPLFRRALIDGLYLRGTIRIGKFFVHKTENSMILIGPAVNNAVQEYENTEWIRISASPNASLTLEQERGIDNLTKISYLV